MEIFKNNKKFKKRLFVLKTLFILSGLLQGVAVILTIPIFKELLNQNFTGGITWFIYIVLIAIVCFFLNYIGMNMGNHMSVWEA